MYVGLVVLAYFGVCGVFCSVAGSWVVNPIPVYKLVSESGCRKKGLFKGAVMTETSMQNIIFNDSEGVRPLYLSMFGFACLNLMNLGAIPPPPSLSSLSLSL